MAAAVIWAMHTHITRVQSSALPLRHPQSSPAPSPGWFPVSGNGRDTGRELQQAWLNPEPPITNSPLSNNRASQQLCQQVQAAALARAHSRPSDAPVSPAPPLLQFGLPKKRRHSHLAPRSTGDHGHTWLPISTLPLGEGQGACTNPVLPQKEPLSDEVLGKKCWNT